MNSLPARFCLVFFLFSHLVSSATAITIRISGAPKKQNTDPPITGVHKQVDSYIKAKVQELAITGLAVAVVKGGKTIFQQGYGLANLEWQLPVTSHTSFQIASCSKLLASTLVMKAIYDKKLTLDDSISRFVDNSPASWQGMQLKHLLTHSSGIKSFQADPYLSINQFVDLLKDSSLAYPYGTNQHYVSFDYALVRFILEKVYQKPYEQILKEVITEPLGMSDGGYDMEKLNGRLLETKLVSRKATTYYGPTNQKIGYKGIYPAYMYAAGGYFASVNDMASWAIGLDKGILFPPTFLDTMLLGQDSIKNKLSDFNRVGWIVSATTNKIQYVGHPGGPALGEILRFPKEGYTVIVLSNDGELLPNLALAVAGFYIKGLTDKPAITKFKRTGSL